MPMFLQCKSRFPRFLGLLKYSAIDRISGQDLFQQILDQELDLPFSKIFLGEEQVGWGLAGRAVSVHLQGPFCVTTLD
jgi:hypothetical protein